MVMMSNRESTLMAWSRKWRLVWQECVASMWFQKNELWAMRRAMDWRSMRYVRWEGEIRTLKKQVEEWRKVELGVDHLVSLVEFAATSIKMVRKGVRLSDCAGAVSWQTIHARACAVL